MKPLSLFLTLLAAAMAVSAYGLPGAKPKVTPGSGQSSAPLVLFVCEHGSAKSVVAAAHFTKLATERLLNVRAISRGVRPDPEIAAKAAAGLRSESLAPLEKKPRQLSPEDLKGAARVVAFCELPEEYEIAVPVERWTDVPPISEDYQRSRDVMVERIIVLLDDLERAK